MFLLRKILNKFVRKHFCSRYSINIDLFDLSFLSQSVLMNINMFQFQIKFQHFFIQNCENLTIIAQNMQFFHEIKSNRFKKSFSSNNLYAAEWFVVQTESVGLVLSVVSISVWVSRPWNQIEVIWSDSGFADSDPVD